MVLSTGKGSLPLYLQIKEMLVAKISGGEWLPSDLIPSELQLAQELSVSQGTVRKAITELVENNILVRKQGRGTFVANHDTQRALFHFFHIVNDDGVKVLPNSRTLSCRRKRATRLEASRLQLPSGSSVVSIERVRELEGRATIVEVITLSADPFSNLIKPKACDLPNMLYELYEKQFGMTVHTAEEKLRAIAAPKRTASLLNVPEGSPLLEIERIALGLDRTPIELRISQCSTVKHYYQNTVF